MKKKGLIAVLTALSLTLVSCGGAKTETAQTGTSKTDEAKQEMTEVQSVEQNQVYVSPDWVKSVIDGNKKESENYKILEVSWGDESASPTYTTGHIKGAVHLNTDSIESEEFWNYRSAEEFKQLFLDYGITKDTTVIVYSKNANDSADDRVALGFLWAGVENVKALDGGIEAWEKAGFELETASNEPSKTDAEFGAKIPIHSEYILSIDQVKEKLESDPNFKLVSIRSKDEFDGITSGYSYIPRAGEPLGAIWGHDTDDGSYTKEDGTQAGIETLEGYLAESEASLDNELSFYCGTGWRAAIPFLIAYQNGVKNISLYDGGWNQWQMDPNNKVQLGDPKSGNMVETTVGELSTDKAKV